MAKFYLKRPNAQKTSIFTRIPFGNPKKYLKYYFDLSVVPKYWNAEKQMFEGGMKYPQRISINAYLSSAGAKIDRLLLDYKDNQQEPTREQLKYDLDKIFKPETIKAKENKEPTLVEFTDHLINTLPLKRSTLVSYKTVKDNFTNYEKKRRKVLKLDKIDLDFYNDFLKYLEKERCLSSNTIRTRIKILKTILRRADDMNLNVSKDYLKRAFKKPAELETENVYLTTAEIDKLFALEGLPLQLEQIRDLFIIQCDTAFRCSDVKRFNGMKDVENGIIIKRTQKGGNIVSIPISSRVQFILDKYQNHLPKITTEQTYRLGIKEVCKRAGIIDMVVIPKRKGNLTINERVPKYTLVSSHTGRRSFATNSYLMGMDILAIRTITGHKTETAFYKYIKITKRENAEKLKTHPFFNQPILKIAK